MPPIQLDDDVYRRVEAFVPVARAVLDEDVDVETCAGLVFELGLRAGLNSVIQNQDESTFVQAFQQLAESNPTLAYGHVADRVALGADVRAQRERRRRIGFGKGRRVDD